MPAHANRPTVLITGVSSGIGLGMARKFLAEGHRVIGSVRSPEGATKLRQELGERFSPLVFDICNQEELDRAELELRGLLPEGHLDALINNAGSASLGPLLQIAPSILTQHLETLVVGQLRVTQKFFAYLRTPGARPARIINISSISGIAASPYFGCYATAKHAFEGLSKTLREEVRSFGVPVIVVAPGNIATDIWPKQRLEQIEPFRGTDYYPALLKKLEWIETEAVPNAMSVEEFTMELYRIYSDPAPRERYTVIKGKRPGFPFSRRRVRTFG